MTDKQIMIDGVDVSGCDFYQIEANELYPKANYCGSMRNTFCEIEPNCYYKQLKRAEQECKRLKWYMQEIRMQELSHLDIEWDEYETHCANTEYSNIINLVEEALKERSPEDCRYDQ